MPSEQLSRAATFGLVLLLTLLLVVWGAFLVPLRVHGARVPVSVLLAVATVPLGRAGATALQRRAGAVVPMLLWLTVAVLLSSQRREGDLIVTGDLTGLAFLLVGVLGGAYAVGSWRPED